MNVANMAETDGVNAMNCVHNLTITEDQNNSIDGDGSRMEMEESTEPYKHGFRLSKYYKLCLKYYHKGTPFGNYIFIT